MGFLFLQVVCFLVLASCVLLAWFWQAVCCMVLASCVLLGLGKLCASWSSQGGASWSWQVVCFLHGFGKLCAAWSWQVAWFLVLASCVLLGLYKLCGSICVLLGLGMLSGSGSWKVVWLSEECLHGHFQFLMRISSQEQKREVARVNLISRLPYASKTILSMSRVDST